ncbi:hypothetical protein [Leisingera caerulea]|uniref:hypothetical protein n=1 Tax=Leisingera caerulea TaxID=506591 RepID=UPI00042A7142|nr:hypothetical protein [Leisingera caerulea]
MQINWTPMRRDEALTINKAGDSLTINGEVFDFSPLPDGATLPRDAVACEWLASDVERSGGEISLTLILPHGANAPEEIRFPQPVVMAADGPVPVPRRCNPETEDEEEDAV